MDIYLEKKHSLFYKKYLAPDKIANIAIFNDMTITFSKDPTTNAYWHTVILENNDTISIIDCGNLKRVNVTGDYITSITCFVPEDDAVYTGECAQLKKDTTVYDLLPHGKGRWVFSDGRIFDGGAFRGAPDGIGIDENGKRVEYFMGEIKV